MLVHNGKALGYFTALKEAEQRARELAIIELGTHRLSLEQTIDGLIDDGTIYWTFKVSSAAPNRNQHHRISSFWVDANR
jgi:hypothetical protein